MPRPCAVCIHPKRQEIDKTLASSGCVIRDTALRYGVHWMAVWRHTHRHLPESLIVAARADSGRLATNLLGRVDRMVARLEKLADNCADQGTGKDLLAVARDLRPYHELLGKVSGEIANDKVTALLIEMGVRSPDEAKSRLALTRGGESLSFEEVLSDAVESLKMVFHKRPDLRQDALRELQAASYAEVVTHGEPYGQEGNGSNGSR